MKRLHCPKCDEPILFDDSLYQLGRTLVFECSSCRKQFKIRVGSNRQTTDKVTQNQEEKNIEAVGYLVVIENAFHLRQEIPLYEGENRVGKHVRGTKANATFKTVDPSVDNTHCIITVQKDKLGQCKFILRDGPSGTGTFVMNELVGVKERVNLSEGAIITLGASTIILREGVPQENEN